MIENNFRKKNLCDYKPSSHICSSSKVLIYDFVWVQLSKYISNYLWKTLKKIKITPASLVEITFNGLRKQWGNFIGNIGQIKRIEKSFLWIKWHCENHCPVLFLWHFHVYYKILGFVRLTSQHSIKSSTIYRCADIINKV